jgi:hypothetical protein
MYTSTHSLLHGRPTLLSKGAKHVIAAGSRTARGKITVSDIYIPNRLDYCVIFIVRTSFTNVAADHGLDTRGLLYIWPNDTLTMIRNIQPVQFYCLLIKPFVDWRTITWLLSHAMGCLKQGLWFLFLRWL